MTTPAGWYPAHDQTGAERYWDGAAWTDQTQPTENATPTTPPRLPGAAWYRKRWVQIVGALVLGLILGGVVGSSSASDADKRAAAAESKARSAQEAETAALGRASIAEQAAQQAGNAADAKVAAKAAALDARSRALDARAAKIGALEQQAKVNTIPGDGLFLVGADVKPGVYRASAADSGNCYYARLRSTNSTDIIDNGNTSGPVVVTLKASDRAFQTSGCNDFHKIA